VLFALGATSSIWDALQSLRAQSGTTSQTTATAFEPIGDLATPESTATACCSGSCSSPLSSQTLGALIAAHSSSVVDPSRSLPAASQNTIGQSAAFVSYGGGQIGQLPEFFGGAAGHFNLAGITGKPAADAGATASSAPSGSVGGSGDTGVSSTDPQAQIAGASPTTVTNADGSTTTSFTWPDGTKVSLTAPAPSSHAPSVAWPSNLASLSYNQIAQPRPIEAQSLSNSAPFAINS
jgi:hypothetical protein